MYQVLHGEDYGTLLMYIIAIISTMMLRMILPLYLQTVARKRRSFSPVMVTGSLIGLATLPTLMTLIQVARGHKFDQIDVVGYAAASYNLYYCWISPKRAEQIWNEAKSEIQTNQLEIVKRNKIEMKKEKGIVRGMKRTLNIMKLNGNGEDSLAGIKEAFKQGRKRMKELTERVLTEQNKVIDNTESWMSVCFVFFRE